MFVGRNRLRQNIGVSQSEYDAWNISHEYSACKVKRTSYENNSFVNANGFKRYFGRAISSLYKNNSKIT